MPSKIDIIVLAAGNSRRMDGVNKLLLNVKDQAILSTVLNELKNVLANQKIVVTGFQAEKIGLLVDGNSYETVKNPNFENGMTSSIQTGISALTKDSIGALILPGDLPFIKAEIIELMTEQFYQNLSQNKQTILAASQNGITKNPVIFSSYYYSEILNHHANNGCRQIVESNMKNLTTFNVNNSYFFRDIDTPEDYKKLKDETAF